MDKKKKKKKAVTNKKQYHLITNLANEHRNTSLKSFDNKEELQDYVVEELQENVGYDFEDGDDIVTYGELQKVSVTEKMYKVNIK